MPSIQVTGILEDPTTGVESNGELRIISKINYGKTTKNSDSTVVLTSAGAYNFQLAYGKHLIAVKSKDSQVFTNIGTVVVGEGSPSPIDIITLIATLSEEPDPILITQLQLIAAEVSQEASNASQSADSAQNSAQEAANTLTQVISEKLLISESESLATRERNKLLFAASDFVYHGKHFSNANLLPINQGLYSTISTPNQIAMGASANLSGAIGDFKTNVPVINIAGVLMDLEKINSTASNWQAASLLLPPAPDGTVTYDSASGAIVQHADAVAAFAHADTSSTIEVVTERVDLVGLEFWLEEITDDEIFPFCIQSLATTFGNTGIPTVNSSRPDSYFAVYDGQTGIQKGKCVKWSTLTDAQKRKVCAYLGESFFINENGNLVQMRVRQRSIAGAGNGDWGNVDSAVNTELMYSSTSGYIVAQGRADAVNAFWYGASRYTAYKAHTLERYQKGVFSTRESRPDLAYNGECYFYVIATVPRLNQGACHPSLNPMGASRVNGTDGYGKFWYSPDAIPLTTKRQCFHKAVSNSEAGLSRLANYGKIGMLSGRPDGKFYDAIYASGIGGVIDHRLKYGAWDASSSEQAAVVREEVKSGVYRGREKLVFSKVHNNAGTGTNSEASYLWWFGGTGFNIYADLSEIDVSVGDVVKLYDATDGFIVEGVITSIASDNAIIMKDNGKSAIYGTRPTTGKNGTGNEVYFIIEHKIDLSIEAAFTQTDVIGDPANILLTDALKDGWLGSWIPVIPQNDITQEIPATRKALSTLSIGNVIRTGDSGATWSSVTAALTTAANTFADIFSTGHVGVINYTAFAKQTKQSSNLAVLNGVSGLLPVFHSFRYLPATGVLLGESMLGIMVKSDRYGEIYGDYSIKKLTIATDLITTVRAPFTHEEILAPATTNDSHAFKAAFHQINDSEQANLNIIANELIYDETAMDWGDDGSVKVVASSTFTDLNGNVCKSDIHKLSKPYGWIKNQI